MLQHARTGCGVARTTSACRRRLGIAFLRLRNLVAVFLIVAHLHHVIIVVVVLLAVALRVVAPLVVISSRASAPRERCRRASDAATHAPHANRAVCRLVIIAGQICTPAREQRGLPSEPEKTHRWARRLQSASTLLRGFQTPMLRWHTSKRRWSEDGGRLQLLGR